MAFAQELAVAKDIVRRSALLVHRVQQEMVSPALSKGDRSPVTVGDFAAQAVVAATLAETFPDDPLVAEEDTRQLAEQDELCRQVVGYVGQLRPGASRDDVLTWIDRGTAEPSRRFWTLDPIDGTKGFLRGEQYAVCLALVIDGTLKVGVLGCPHLADGGRPDIGGPGSLLFAVEGEGAFTEPLVESDESPPRPLQVSPRTEPSQARLLRSVESGHTNLGQIDEVTAALAIEVDPVPVDSQAKFAMLASGSGELMVRLLSPSRPDYREKIWDQAAGVLIVRESGGRVTDLDGRSLDFSAGRTLANNRGIVASNGRLHEAVLAALRQVSA